MNEINTVKQRKLGVILGYLNFAVKMLVQIIYVPIMLRFLGQSEYGVYQLVGSIISYLSLLSFGFDGAYLRFYAKYKDDKRKESILNGTYMFVFGVFSVVVLVIGIMISLNAEAILGNKLTVDEISLSKILLFIMALNMALTFLISVFSSIVTSREAFVFQKLVELLKNIANPFLTIFLLLIGKGSVGIVCVTTLLTIIGGIVNIWYVFKKLKVSFSFKQIDFSLIKEIGFFSFFIFLGSIIDQINWNVDKYILGRIVGSTAIAVYSIGAQINTIYVQISDMIASVMVTKVNLIVASEPEPMESLNKLFVKVGRIQAYIIVAVVSGFVMLGKDFIQVWAGSEYAESYYITLFLIVPASIPLMQSLGVDIQKALNKHQIRAMVYAIIAILNVGISILLVYKYGAIGASIGTAIALIVGNGIIMNIVYKKNVGLNIFCFWRNVIPVFGTSIIPVATMFVINSFWQSVSWGILIFKGMVFVMLYFLSAYFLTMNHEEKIMIRDTLHLKS